MPAAMLQGSYLPPMTTQAQVASFVPPQAVEAVVYESVQPVGAVAQPVVAMAQPVYTQTAVAQAVNAVPAVSVSVGSLDMLNQAISLGEVAKPTGAAAYYELYCRMNGQAVPQQSVVSAPQVASYAPPAAVAMEKVLPTARVPDYTMAEQVQTYSYLPQYTEPAVVAAPMMAAPMMTTMAAPGVAVPQGQPESVILDEVGEWLVCEDAMGLFYHHAPTQQSFDQPPPELVQYYEQQGVQLAPTGAFGVQGAVVQQAPLPMTYAGSYQPQPMPATYM